MILLLALTHDQLADVYTPGLGRLLGPRLRGHPQRTVAAGWPWAADNDAYSAWDEQRFRRMLWAISGLSGCLFVTSPDIVGDHPATLERFEHWAPVIRRHRLPVAFVAQDGATPDVVPWLELDALFIGGTNTFKLGPDAANIARHARDHGKWLHMGRVNSLRGHDPWKLQAELARRYEPARLPKGKPHADRLIDADRFRDLVVAYVEGRVAFDERGSDGA